MTPVTATTHSNKHHIITMATVAENLHNSTLSEYERIRAENVERNNRRLRELGLISILEEERSNAAAFGEALPKSEVDDSGSSKENKDCNPITPKKKRKLVKNSSPARKSARLRGENPDGTECPSSPRSPKRRKDRQTERREIVEECRQARQRAALKVMEEGAEKAAKENPTATYEHCLMRVRTMSEKALLTRVKVIERAAGKHCVIKMAIFKSCLQDEGMWEIADKASEALERLKGLQAPPKKV
ncbi:MAG: hypothetical protein SGARI_003125 [Bacillariaceae sp.]